MPARDSKASLFAPGDVVGGKLEIVRVIGAGGMGAVYEARHKGTGRRVAVKLLRPELAASEDASQRFLQEALACGKVRHPNVVDIYDAGVHEDAPFLVMELLEGESLGSRLDRDGALSPSLAVEVVLQAAEGVAAAHDAGIVHRDLKPDNLFLSRGTKGELVVKVVDFGVSKLTQPDLALATTRTGTVMGTPHFMAPEQARGMRDLDGRADVYALGAVLYYALAGRVPFEAENYNSLMVAILNDDPPGLPSLRPEVPQSLAAIVERAMTKDRTKRFQSAKELATALGTERAALPELSETQRFDPPVPARSMPTPYVPPARQTGRRAKRRLALALGVAAVLVAGAATLLAGREDARTGATSARPATAAPTEPPATAAPESPSTAAPDSEDAARPEPPTKRRLRKHHQNGDDDHGIL